MISKELVGASARPLLLTILDRQDSYGYEIIRKIERLSGGQLEWKEGMLYPVLHRLEDEMLVSSYWSEGEAGRRRKYYRLTAAGRESLETEKSHWRLIDSMLSDMWSSEPGLAT